MKSEIRLCPDCGKVWSSLMWKRQSGYINKRCPDCNSESIKLHRGGNMKVILQRHTANPMLSIARSGAKSHDTKIKTIDDARDLIKTLREEGHWSTFEFASAKFTIKNVSRSCLAQLTRHRHASYMVKSQRYNRADEEAMVIPKSLYDWIEESEENAEQFNKWMADTKQLFSDASNDGVPIEDARFIMPIGTETELDMKANFREWRHIIELRGLNEDAQWEVRQLAQKILKQLYQIAPTAFQDLYEEYKGE